MERAWRVIALALPVLLVVAHCLTMANLDAAWRDWLTSEYGPAEILSALLFGTSAVVAAAMLRRRWPIIPARFRTLFVLFALGAAFVAIEEISYGQTFLDYHTPGWFLEHNHQEEFNLHNLAGDKPSRYMRRLGEFGMPVFGLVLPLIWMRRKDGYAPGTFGFHILPRWELLGCVIGSFAVRPIWWWRKAMFEPENFPTWTAGLSELQELIWAFAGVVWIVAISRRMAGNRVIHGRCSACNYDLAGLVTDRCPECGATLAGVSSKPLDSSRQTI